MAEETLFEETPTEETTSAELEQDRSYLEDLVGEGRKFKDSESLARGKLESDRFIEQLQKENAEMRTELRSRQSLQDLMQEIRSNNQTTQRPAHNQEDVTEDLGVTEETNTNLTPEQIEEFVDRKIAQREQTTVQSNNLKEVKSTLRKEWGNNYVRQLSVTAEELGVEESFLNNLAATQPQAFYKLVGIGETISTPPNSPNPSVSNERRNLAGGSINTEKNWAYYEKIRKENPSEYFSINVQQEMFKNAERLGDEFYSNAP